MLIKLRTYFFDAFTFSYLAGIAIIYGFGFKEEDFMALGPWALKYFILFLVGFFLSYLLNRKDFYTLGEHLFAPVHISKKFINRPMLTSLWGWQLLILLIVTFVVGFDLTKTNLFELTDEEGMAGAVRLFGQLGSPNFAILPQAVSNIVVTIFMAFIATALAIPIAFVLSFVAAKNVMKHPVAYFFYMFVRTIFNVARSIEALIWAIIFSVWVGIGPFAGTLALMIHSIASLAKQYSEMIESVSEGPIEGIESTGANPLQVVWFAIVPQVILPFISFTIYRWDINVRMATIIGLVGGGGIGNLFLKYSGQAMWNEVGTVVFVIAVVVWAMDQASALIREALK